MTRVSCEKERERRSARAVGNWRGMKGGWLVSVGYGGAGCVVTRIDVERIVREKSRKCSVTCGASFCVLPFSQRCLSLG